MIDAAKVEQWAREAGFPFNKYGLLQGDEEGEIDANSMFHRFAALAFAAGAEEMREAAAKSCDEAVTGMAGLPRSDAAASALDYRAYVIRALPLPPGIE